MLSKSQSNLDPSPSVVVEGVVVCSDFSLAGPQLVRAGILVLCLKLTHSRELD